MSASYKLDIGTIISLNAGAVITGAIPVSIEVKKPSGAVASWSGAIGADTRSVEHVIASGDFNESGDFILQAKVTLNGGTFYGKSVVYKIKEVFK